MSDEIAPFALVVDDDPFIRMDACDIVAAAGFRCLDAEDAATAVRCLRANARDITLLFTDVQLGEGEDGLWLAREVAQHWPWIGILVASGNVKPEPGHLPDDAIFIGKPFSSHVVHKRLDELLPEGQKPESLKQAVRSALS